MIFGISRQARRRNAALIGNLYGEIVAAARNPVFFATHGVPDTPLGRFETLSLHMFLVMERSRTAGDIALASLVQELVDIFFTDVDHSLRELGIGDMGVPKRMKKLARMFYGRCQSYGTALAAGDETGLAIALSRNIWPQGGADTVAFGAGALASYVLAAHAMLREYPVQDLSSGHIAFPDPGAFDKEGCP